MKGPGCVASVKFVVILILLSLAIYFTDQAFRNWTATPTVANSAWIPLKSMQFPAMTVCPIQASQFSFFHC